MKHLRTSVPVRRQRGMTLIELMVALVIGLLIVVAMTAAFVASSSSRREGVLSADVIETGRYAIDTLGRELSQAGYYGPLVVPAGATSNAGILCARGAANIASWQDSLPWHVVGLRSAGGANVDADPSCISRKAGTDAVFVQRASTCTTVECPDATPADFAYLQVSECGTEYSATPTVLAQGDSTTAFTLQTLTCDGTKAVKRKLIRRIYFVDADSNLQYQEVTLNGALSDHKVLIAENIEQMQIEYAVDSTGDGTADSFTGSPADWSQVIGMRVWLLARSTDSSKNTKDAATFVMADTTVDIAAAAVNPKRRLYSTYISFMTPKSRRET
jgi:type IV pilus assembly protein PilW